MGGILPTVGTLAGFGQLLLFGITGFFLRPIIGMALITLGTMTVLTALIILILNAGAFVVPGVQTDRVLDIAENPFIDVIKTPQPAGPFENSDLPLTITYTITIHAKQSSLESISFESNCEVIKEGTSPPCPETNPPIPSPPDSIYPGAPYTVTYTQEFTSPGFEDSVVIDAFTVNATTADGEATVETGTAAIIIGDGYTECFVLDEKWDQIPQAIEDKSTLLEAIAELMKARTYMEKLCSDGDILIDWAEQSNCWWCGAYVDSQNRHIYMLPAGVSSFKSAVYTLTHETGHIIAAFTDLYQQYIDSQSLANEWPICSYAQEYLPQDEPENEFFPEMIGLYVSQSPSVNINIECFGGQTIKTKYPAHWQFARDYVFEENLSW
jgi:hypothetical protein